MRLFKNALVATLISLSVCSSGCPANTPVQIPVPAPSCSPGDYPRFPRIRPEVCVDGDVELVCLTPADGAAIWAWARETERWSERVRVCVDTRERPFIPGPRLGTASKLKLPPEIARVIPEMAHPGVTVRVDVVDCGTVENAWYYPDTKHVEFCSSLLALPAPVARFILAHELAHAIIVQLDVPYTGSHEEAADELAALVLLATGDDLREVARYWYQESITTEVPTWADHPSHLQRFHTLRCMAAEAAGTLEPLCYRGGFKRAARTWMRLLGQ